MYLSKQEISDTLSNLNLKIGQIGTSFLNTYQYHLSNQDKIRTTLDRMLKGKIELEYVLKINCNCTYIDRVGCMLNFFKDYNLIQQLSA